MKFKKIIQDIYNLKNLTINNIVIRLINHKLVEIIKETDIKNSESCLENATIKSIWEWISLLKL